MNNYNNIDKLFQEKLNELEVHPTSDVWGAIEGKLKKKKRRALPLWWFYGGGAALFILSLFLYPFPEKDLIKDPIDNPINITTAPEKDKTNEEFINNNSDKIEVVKTVIDSTNTPLQISPIKSTSSKLIGENTIVVSDKKEEKFVVEKHIEKPEEKKTFTIEKKVDSIQKKEEKKKIEIKPKKDFLATIVKKDSANEVIKKWSIAPTFAVLNSNSFTGSSPLIAELSSSPIVGETNYSYGMNVAYSINRKWSIQSGVHIQKLSYVNNNLSLISSNSNISNMNSLNNTTSFSVSTLENANYAISSSNASLISHDASLTQVYGYIEIPIEIKYVLLQKKKFNSRLIAGFSSLFLNKNEVFVSSPIISQKLGKANNLNAINFSGNIGLDIDVDFYKNWTWNINPMLKTQLNTFSENANGFRPYLVGVYTGIKYQF